MKPKKKKMTRKQLNERRKNLRDYLCEYSEDIVLFDGPEYDGGIIGLSTDNRVVYSYSKLVDALMEHNDWSAEDAIEWIEYNTIRSLPYIQGLSPIIYFDLDPNEL